MFYILKNFLAKNISHLKKIVLFLGTFFKIKTDFLIKGPEKFSLLWYVWCILKFAGTAFEIFFIMILIACMWTQVPLRPGNFKRLIKYQTFQVPLYNRFESKANIVFPFEANFGQMSIHGYQTVATMKGNFVSL